LKSVRRVVFQPTVYSALSKGIEEMVSAVRPTFGPLHGTVMLSRVNQFELPEILDDGGLIARRIYALPDRDEDVGAMMVRHLMWRMHERFGDATVTAALIYQSVFEQGVKYVLNGGNAMMLRKHLEKAAHKVFEELARQSMPVAGQEQLVHLAETLCREPALARDMGEMLLRVGRNGQVEIKPGQGRQSLIEYINGMTWKGDFFARSMVQDVFKYRSEVEDCAVLVSNMVLDNPYEMAEWLEKVMAAGVRRLVILARESSRDCMTVLEAARKNPEVFDVLAIKLWETSERWELQDLSILTGGQVFAREAGHTIGHVHPDAFGHARQVWIERSQFGIIGGSGEQDQIRDHTQRLLSSLAGIKDESFGRKMRDRIARFVGISAVYHVGGTTRIEIDERVRLAQRLVSPLQGALVDGVLPGGAVAIMNCIPVLAEMQKSADFEEKAAGRIVANALKAPIQALLTNCGENPFDILARIKRRGDGYGYDVFHRKVTCMVDAGVLDVANAVKAAVYGGITGAALGLTVDVVVHPRKRKESYTTG
jgi:chaperonin GroEL